MDVRRPVWLILLKILLHGYNGYVRNIIGSTKTHLLKPRNIQKNTFGGHVLIFIELFRSDLSFNTLEVQELAIFVFPCMSKAVD